MTKAQKIIDLIQEMGISEQVTLHNEYCYKTNNPDDEIFDMDMFDEMLTGQEPSWIANRIHFGHYNPYNEYFTFNGYGNIETIPKYQISDYIYENDIANFIIDNDIDFDIDDIRYILDDIDDMEE